MNKDKSYRADYRADYREKIKLHLFGDLTADEINNFLNFLNWCFKVRNNFLIENFNRANLSNILFAYNKIKSNILSPDTNVKVFDNLTTSELKILKFICWNLFHTELTEEIDIDCNQVRNISKHIIMLLNNK